MDKPGMRFTTNEMVERNDKIKNLVQVLSSEQQAKGFKYYCCEGEILGEGGYGKVLKGFAIKRKKKIPVAIKIGRLSDVKEFVKDAKLGDVPREVSILKQLPKHPAATRFVHYQKTSSQCYAIVMERPKRSRNLYELRGTKGFPFSEKRARKITRQLCGLLFKMQRMKLSHNDIKPQNVVYDLEKHAVKLVDFGLAGYFEEGKFWNKFHGTQSFMPPEFLVSGSYEATKATVWSLGILTYYLLTGCRPFEDAAQAVSQRFGPPTHLKDLSTDARNLIEGMLSADPNKRLNLEQVTKHPWMNNLRRIPLHFKRETFQNSGKVKLPVSPF